MLTDDHTTVMLDTTQALLLYGDISASLLASLPFLIMLVPFTLPIRPEIYDVAIITFLCISIANFFLGCVLR